MGKQRRIKEERRARAIIEKLADIDAAIKQTEAEIKTLESQKAQQLADILTESPERRTMQLGDMLNSDQIQAVIDILNRPNLDDIAQTKAIKQYLNTFRPQLERIGVLPDYLAYMLMANADALRQMARQSNDRPPDPFQPPPNAQN